MLAKLIVSCRLAEIRRVSEFMNATGLSQNNEHWHQEPCQVHGDYVQYFDPSLEQAKALEQLRASPGVGSCELHF